MTKSLCDIPTAFVLWAYTYHILLWYKVKILLTVFSVHAVHVTYIAGQVVATDNDTDSWNSYIDYNIQFFGKELPLSIDHETGVILSQITNLDNSATFLFGVVAQDRGLYDIHICV